MPVTLATSTRECGDEKITAREPAPKRTLNLRHILAREVKAQLAFFNLCAPSGLKALFWCGISEVR